MYMTYNEITRLYRSATSDSERKKKIKIIAELNGVSKEEMIQYLKDHDVNVPE